MEKYAMKYSIEIKTALSLKVRVGEFETFEEAKQQMVKVIVDLINNQKDEVNKNYKLIDKNIKMM